MVIGSFVLFLLAFVLIGAAATLKSERTSTDYLVANRTVRPWLVGLSAMATNNSGYLFIAVSYTHLTLPTNREV